MLDNDSSVCIHEFISWDRMVKMAPLFEWLKYHSVRQVRKRHVYLREGED